MTLNVALRELCIDSIDRGNDRLCSVRCFAPLLGATMDEAVASEAE